MLLWSERLYVALPEDHDLARHEAIEWQMLADEPILARGWESGSLAYNCLVARMAPDRDLPHIDQHFAGRENLIGLVGAGYGVTVVPEAAPGGSYPGERKGGVEGKGWSGRGDHGVGGSVIK